MKTNILSRATVLLTALLLLIGCIFENPETAEDGSSVVSGTIEVAVNMPENTPQTRITLEESGKDIDLAWEDNDQLDLLIVYDGNKQKQTVTVAVDPVNKKKATFPLNLPGGTYTTFDLYGVYGGGGFSNTPGQEHLVVLPTLEQATSGAL